VPKTPPQTGATPWPSVLQQLAADLRWASARLLAEQGQPMEAAYDWQTRRGMERAAGLLNQWAAIADGGRHHRTAPAARRDRACPARSADDVADVIVTAGAQLVTERRAAREQGDSR
jgi:hypothetical protein